jgi:hypothetical protein
MMLPSFERAQFLPPDGPTEVIDLAVLNADGCAGWGRMEPDSETHQLPTEVGGIITLSRLPHNSHLSIYYPSFLK